MILTIIIVSIFLVSFIMSMINVVDTTLRSLPENITLIPPLQITQYHVYYLNKNVGSPLNNVIRPH